jgi:predicted transposase YbfD/YdcC
MDHTSRGVLGQTDVDTMTNEITGFQPLLEGLDLAGRVLTADALHTQRAHANWLVTVKRAACILIVKANQPIVHHQLATLPTPRVGPLTGHKWRAVTVYAVTNLTAAQAHPARLTDWIRSRGIEALHHIRDTIFAEDASQIPTGNATRTMASLRNLAIAILRAPTAIATSPPRYAATPVTPLESCHSSASQTRDQPFPHYAAALPLHLPAASRVLDDGDAVVCVGEQFHAVVVVAGPG